MAQPDVSRGRRIIARLDRLPVWPYPKYVMIIVGIGFFFAYFDILTIGLGLPAIRTSLHTSLAHITWAITSGLIGYIVGSFINSRIADKYGRRLSLYFSISAFTIGSILCAFSMHLSWLIIWRFVSGMGIGAEIASVTTFMEELSPARVRGRATSTAVAYGMVGFAVIPFIALYLIPNFTWGWRALFILGGLGGLTILPLRKLLPGSPRWLFIHNRLDEAESIVANAENYVTQRLKLPLAPVPDISHHPFIQSTSLTDVTRQPHLSRIIMFASIWFFYYLGNYAWLSLATTLFVKHGFNIADSIGFVAISSVGFVIGSIIVVFLAERIERKWLAAMIALIWTMALLIIGWVPNPIVIIAGGLVATTTIAMIIPILYIYTGENFPTRMRATCLSITDGIGHLGGAFCGQIIFFIAAQFSHISFGMSFTTMAASGFIVFLLLLFGIRMTQQSLTELVK